jgi:hypothetical protein
MHRCGHADRDEAGLCGLQWLPEQRCGARGACIFRMADAKEDGGSSRDKQCTEYSYPLQQSHINYLAVTGVLVRF